MRYINIVTTIIMSIFSVYVLYNIFGQKCKIDICDNEIVKFCDAHKKRIFIILLFIAAFFRLYKLGNVPGAINQDTACAAVNAKSIMQYGVDLCDCYMPVHLNAWGYSQMSVGLAYLMIPFIKLFGLNQVAVCIPNAIFSILGIIAGYFFVKKTFGVCIAQIFMFVTAFNPWHFVQSRWPLEANLFPHFFIIALMLLIIGIYSRKRVFLIISMIVFGLSHYNYGVSLYIVPIFLLITVIMLYRNKLISISNIIISVIVYLLFSCNFYVMIFINTFHLSTIETPFFTIPYFPESNRSKDIIFFSDHPLSQLIENIKCIFKVVILQEDEILWSNIPHMGMIFICMIPVMLLGMIVVTKMILSNCNDDKRIIGSKILLVWLFVSIIDGLITKDINSNRINIIFYCLIIFIAIGLYYILTNVKKWMGLVCITVVVVMSLLLVTDYFTTYAERFYDPEYAFSGNLSLALQKAQGIEAEHYVVTPDTQYIGARDVTEFDTLFFFNIDSEYFRGLNNTYEGTESIPYSEKFQYRKVTLNDAQNMDASTVYIVNSGDQSIFSDDYFEKYDYIQFYVIAPKNMVEGK